MTCIYNIIDKKHDMYIQLNVDESLNLLKKKHDMYIQLNVHESLNLLKKKHYATLH